jgi:hypothetical protein
MRRNTRQGIALLYILIAGLFSKVTAQSNYIPTFQNCKQCIVLCEQSVHRIAILDLDKKAITWEWQPEQSPNIKKEHAGWFKNPSDAKPVIGGTAILLNASGGGVALIRIADKKALFYAFAGGNTHSAELLPDGNIVSASSTGNFMTVFRTDTTQFPDNVYSKQFYLPSGHNVVWDKKQNLLWSAAKDQLKTFTYNFNRLQPDLTVKDSIQLPGTDAHDLFPVYGLPALWLTNTTATYYFNIEKNQASKVPLPYAHVKSMSSGPSTLPTIFIHPDGTKGSWWTDEIYATDGKVIYKQHGLKIYKARWFVENAFSY